MIFTMTLLLALTAPAQPPQNMLAEQLAALELRVTALESRVENRQSPRSPAAPDGLFGQLPAARPAGDGWTLDHARGVWWRPMPAGDAGAFAAVPYYGAAFGDGASACGPGGCGPAAGGGYRFAPFGGRFRR